MAPRIAARTQFATIPPVRATIALANETASAVPATATGSSKYVFTPGEIGKYSRAPDQDFRDGNDQDNRENRIASAVSAISPSDSDPQDRDMCLEDHN